MDSHHQVDLMISLKHLTLFHIISCYLNYPIMVYNLVHIKEGATSSEKVVLSEVPQGTVLGPLMFLLYVNDIDENINSCVCLFADDSVYYIE